MTNKEIRKLSKEQLKNRKVEFGLLTIVECLLLGLGYVLLDDNFSMIELFLSSIITITFTSIYLQMSRTGTYKVFDGIRNYKAWLRSFGISMIFSVCIFFVLLISEWFEAATGISFQNAILNSEKLMSGIIGVIESIFIIIILIALIIFAISISQYEFLLVDGYKIFDSIGESIRIMKGNEWRFICLIFSFIGWFLLGTLTLGILLLWVIPYSTLAFTNFYRDIKGEFADKVEEIEMNLKME